MSCVRVFCFTVMLMYFCECGGITNNENNLIGEEDRRGVIVKEERKINDQHDQRSSESTKRGLWLIGQHQPSGYDSSGSGGYGYVDPGGYGLTGSGYSYGASTGGGYYKGSGIGHGYGYSAGGSNFGHEGFNYGHSGYEESGHGVTHGNEIYNKLALKKLLIPLAGLAILGAAAALSTNPVLLQLGTIQSGRKKRSILNQEIANSDIYPMNPWVEPDTKQ